MLAAPRLETARREEIPEREEIAALELRADLLAVSALPSLDQGEVRATAALRLETAERLETPLRSEARPRRDADSLR